MGLGIYVHIPYCMKKCNYCDFNSYSGIDETIPEYFNVLNNEILYNSSNIINTNINNNIKLSNVNSDNKIDNNCVNKYEVDSIFIGGGTPSIVDVKYIEKVLDSIYKNYNVSKSCEISIECNPGTLTEEKVRSYFICGINRISLGLQSAVNNELMTLGRIHTFEDYEKSLNYCVKAGFENINTDIITGVPGQTAESLLETLNKICAMTLTHISAYSLIIEDETNFGKIYDSLSSSPGVSTLSSSSSQDAKYPRQDYDHRFRDRSKEELPRLPGEDEERDMYYKLIDFLNSKNFKHYEISNFAKKNYECNHNKKYWCAEEYLGFGCAAHSFFNGKRYWNYSDVNKYIVNGKELSFQENYEIINKEESMKEYIMMGLRMTEGININKFNEKYNENLKNIFRNEIEKTLSLGLIDVGVDKIKLTHKGLDYANIAFMEFV